MNLLLLTEMVFALKAIETDAFRRYKSEILQDTGCRLWSSWCWIERILHWLMRELATGNESPAQFWELISQNCLPRIDAKEQDNEKLYLSESLTPLSWSWKQYKNLRGKNSWFIVSYSWHLYLTLIIDCMVKTFWFADALGLIKILLELPDSRLITHQQRCHFDRIIVGFPLLLS